MSKYLIDDISKLSIYQKENNIEEYNKFVKETALSNISNKYFARPWENHIEIVYWQGFLDVLFSRGIDNIQDVKNDLLEWLDDPCRLGFAEVCDFIVQNKNQFIPLLKRKIIKEFYNKEFQYVIHLFLVYNKCSNSPKDIDSIVNKMDEFDIEGIDEDRMVEYGNELENILNLGDCNRYLGC